MKKIAIAALSCLLTLGFAFAGGTTSADQKWLLAVEKMVADGQTTVSTPNKERMNLLKEWADKKGYSVEVTESDASYRLRLSKSVAKK